MEEQRDGWKVLAMLTAGSAGCLAMFYAACSFPVDDDSEMEGAATDTDGDGNPDRGWKFECKNLGQDPNFNWQWYAGLCEGDPDTLGCWVHQDPFNAISVCINATNVSSFDPSNWMMFDDGIRMVCSERCENQNGMAGIGDPGDPPDPKCDDEDWSNVVYSGPNSYAGEVGSECSLADYEQLELDPTGNTIVWPDQSSAPTACDLYDGECDAEFDALLYPWVSHIYPHEDIGIDTRRADFLAVSTTSSVTFDASRGEFVLPLNATVEFSTASCSSAGCPFYLANVEAVQTGGPLAIEIPYNHGYLDKELSGFKVDLLHSAWGIEHHAQDWFVMTKGTVALQVEFTLTNTDGNATGDGTFTKVLINDDEIFGDSTSTGLDSIVFEKKFIPGMDATIELDDADKVERPPVVSDNLPPTLQCPTPSATEVELDTYVWASDPDADVDVVGWLIDGDTLYDEDVGLGNGTYNIAAVAIDTRGAVDVGPQKVLTVSGCS